MRGPGVNLLPGVSLVKILVYLAIIAGIFGAGVYVEHGRMQKKLDKVTADFNQFKGGVAALGREAAARNAKTALNDIKRKERADEENARRTAALAAAVAKLRADADRTRGGFVSALAAAARRADKAEEFGAKFERAYRELVQEIRAVGDDGDKAVTDLDSAKEWAAHDAGLRK